MSFEVLIPPTASRRSLATIAIGDACYATWHGNAFPLWESYCRRHGLGLIVVRGDLIPTDHQKWKKATWQKMLLGQEILTANLNIEHVCYLDTDILISPLAPNVFEHWLPDTIGVVSQIKNLPQDRDLTLRLVAFNRHTHYSNNYPLDSALFMSPRQIFEFHGLYGFDDYACMGMFLFNVSKHSQVMRSWFDHYDAGVDSLTGGGDEPHMNFELQSWGHLSWLPYTFHTLWIYEIAWKYPFLYQEKWRDDALVRACIQASLTTSHFLHFAGSWHECDMWKTGPFFQIAADRDALTAFSHYLHTPVTGQPQGLIKPNKSTR